MNSISLLLCAEYHLYGRTYESFRRIPRCAIAGSQVSSIFQIAFYSLFALRKLHVDFHTGTLAYTPSAVNHCSFSPPSSTAFPVIYFLDSHSD